MKKILHSTVAFVALGVFSSTAFAQAAPAQTAPTKATPAKAVAKPVAPPSSPIKLELGGYANWYLTYANQRKTTLVDYGYFLPDGSTVGKIGKYNMVDVMGDAEITFSGSTELNNGLKVSAIVELEAGTDPSTSSETIDQAYMTVDGKFGRIIAGNVKSVAEQMAVTSPTVSTLGVQESDFARLILRPDGVDTLDSTYARWDDTSTKISYITPTMAGFTVGFSFMPSNNPSGQDDNNLSYNPEYYFRYAGAISTTYEQKIGSMDLVVGGTYAFFKPNSDLRDGLTANFDAQDKTMQDISGGLNLGFGNITVGGSYRRVLADKNTTFDPMGVPVYSAYAELAGYAYDAGISYMAGPYEFSLNYLFAKTDSPNPGSKDSKHDLITASAKYKLGAGVDLFTDVGYVRYKDKDTMAVADRSTPAGAAAYRQAQNKGLAIAAGMNLAF